MARNKMEYIENTKVEQKFSTKHYGVSNATRNNIVMFDSALTALTNSWWHNKPRDESAVLWEGVQNKTSHHENMPI